MEQIVTKINYGDFEHDCKKGFFGVFKDRMFCPVCHAEWKIVQ